ncbi:MAG: T9SS type A sorting domain-containing protein [Bacteroidota bacterium]
MIVILCVFISASLHAFTVKTVAHGDWEDPTAWSNQQVPTNPDSIIVYHYMVIHQNLTINAPTVLFIDPLGTICGDYLLETMCGASFVNYGHLYLGQIKTRAGLNYHYIACKNSLILNGCSAGGGYYNNLPPNGSTYVWPPVLCKTQDTNWELGNQIGLIELENYDLKIYPNPIVSEMLQVVTLSSTRIRLTDVKGKEIKQKTFENRTELDLNTLAPGIYYLELEINGKRCVRKIVKSD